MAEKGALQFINLSKPRDSLDPANRKLVRRNATLHRSRNRQVAHISKEDVTRPLEQLHFPMGIRLQPFPVAMQRYMYFLLEYVEKVMFPSLFPLRDMYQYHPGHRMTMCLALQDARVLNSQVALASLRYASTERKADAKSFMVTGLKHQQQAMSYVKAWLAESGGSSVDAGVAICIAHLASIELMLQNLAGWEAHMYALRKMAEHSSTVSNLSIAQSIIIDTELCGCYFFDKQPCFVQKGDLELFRAPDLNDNESQTEMLSLSILQEMIPIDKRILDCIVNLEQLQEMLSLPTNITLPELYITSFVSARVAVEHRLLRLRHDEGLDNLSKAVCFAAQIYVNMVLRTFRRGTLFLNRIAERLRATMEVVLGETKQNVLLPASMLWAAVMGGLGAQNGPVRAWFVNCVYSACRDMGLRSWDDIRNLTRGWSWSERYIGDSATELWADIDAIITNQVDIT